MEMKDNETIGLKTVIVRYLLRWRLFLAAFVFSLVLAVLYLVFYPRTYEVMARVQLRADKEAGADGLSGEASSLMKSFGMGGISGGGVNMDDELMTLTSNKLLRGMVLALGVNAEYKKPFTFGYRLYGDTPFILSADSLTDARLDEEVEFTVSLEGREIEVSARSGTMDKTRFRFNSLPAVMELPQGTFHLAFSPGKENIASAKLNIDYRPAGWVAEELEKEFLIEESSKTSNVVELSCRDYEKSRGKDMLNTLIALYNKHSDARKKEEAGKTLAFLDRRIAEVATGLAEAESRIEAYKGERKLTDVGRDVQLYVDQMRGVQDKLVELEGQANVVGMMDTFIKDPANKYDLIPVLLTLPESGKGGSIANYNNVLLERARVIQNSSPDNPLVGTLSQQADKLRASVVETIGNAYKGHQKTIADLRAREFQAVGKMNNYPGIERQYVELERQRNIAQGVYLLLSQKREGTVLFLGQALDKARVIDPAYTKGKPVAPRKLFAAIGIFVLSLLLPIAYLFCEGQMKSLAGEYRRQRQGRGGR